MREIERTPLAANVGALLDDAAERYRDRPFLVFFDDDTLSYAGVARLVRDAAGALAAIGVGAGSHVGVMLPTARDYPITWLALARLGAVTIPINFNYTPRELACEDETGWFFYLGRMKEMVRRSSENVSAVEVERILRGVDGVLEAAVAPVPDELRGEEVKAYLKPDPGAAPDDALLLRVFEHCAKNLARFRIPRYVEFVEEFPRTPSLKIKKSALLSVKEELRVGSFDRAEGR